MIDVEDHLIHLLADTFGVPQDQVKLESKWTDFGHDSLDLVEIVIALQEELDVTLDPKELGETVTVADLAQLIGRKKL
jgi:acyl carrier protein